MMAGEGWRVVTRWERGRHREYLQIDGEEYYHVPGSTRAEVEARVEQIRWDRIVDYAKGDRR